MSGTLLDNTRDFIAKEQLFTPSDRLCLAISGGIDSVALAHILKLLGYQFSLAHVNFQLRGPASDGDEAFVKQLAQRLGVDIWVRRSNAKDRAAMSGASIQMAARDIRYEWFAELHQEGKFDALLTAHHLDDNLETTLLNLIRGTGFTGLAGILPKKGIYRRPLLAASRNSIVAFAREQGFSWREDASNLDLKYRRNALRLKVIPALQQLQPEWESVLRNSYSLLRHQRELLAIAEAEHFQNLLDQEGHITRAELPSDPMQAHLTLWPGLRPMGFSREQIRQLTSAKTGTEIIAEDQPHVRAVITQEKIKLYTSPPDRQPEILITELPAVFNLEHGHQLRIERIARPDALVTAPNTAFFSVTAIAFPLQLRPWRAGDRFRPFGMKGQQKKIQDFLTDLKLDRQQKQQVLVLCDATEEIIWVAGYRASEKGRVEGKDSEVLRITMFQ